MAKAIFIQSIINWNGQCGRDGSRLVKTNNDTTKRLILLELVNFFECNKNNKYKDILSFYVLYLRHISEFSLLGRGFMRSWESRGF